MTGNRILDLMIESFGTILIPGLTMTLPLTAISFAIGLMIAVVTALVQFANIQGLKQLARFYVWVIRGTPLLVQLFVVFYGLPNVGILIDPFPAAVLVFSINQGAYCSETIRAALESVPAGQMEAGQCVGMSYLQIIRRIILPQAMRTAFPPLSNSLIGLVKDTSLAANITVVEMFMATQRIVARTFESLALYIEVGIIYLLFCTVLTKLAEDRGEKARFLRRKTEVTGWKETEWKRDSMLEVKGIRKSFGSLEVLKGVDLTVNRGDVIAIVGPSGSGKTTLLRCMNFLEMADAGTMTFDGQLYRFGHVSRKEAAGLRRRTGFVFQNYNLFANKTALQNVTEGLIVARKIPKSRAEQTGREALDKVGLSDRYDYYPAQLSADSSSGLPSPRDGNRSGDHFLR